MLIIEASTYLGSLQRFEGAAGEFKGALGFWHPLISSLDIYAMYKQYPFGVQLGSSIAEGRLTFRKSGVRDIKTESSSPVGQIIF